MRDVRPTRAEVDECALEEGRHMRHLECRGDENGPLNLLSILCHPRRDGRAGAEPDNGYRVAESGGNIDGGVSEFTEPLGRDSRETTDVAATLRVVRQAGDIDVVAQRVERIGQTREL